MSSDALTDEPAMNRRMFLYGGVAAAAAAAGAALAWWKLQPKDTGADAAARLWPLSFQTPEGGTLPMAALRGKPLLLNFWATWCPPCVEEMPLLDGFFRQNGANGWQVVGLAIDQPEPVRSFLKRVRVTFPIGLAAANGQELSRALGNSAEALPYSVLIGRDGQVVQRKMGRLTSAELTRWQQLP